MKLEKHSLTGLRSLLDAGVFSPPEVAQYFLDRIDLHDREHTCFQAVNHEDAMAQATRAQALYRQKSVRPLTGIPLALCEDIPPHATIYHKLSLYGVVLPGVFRMDQWGMVCQKGLVPAAVGAGACLLPDAGRAGFIGFIPTPGVISRYGLTPETPPVGFAVRCTEDCAVLLDALSDYDPLDTDMPQIHSFQYGALIGAPAAGLRVLAAAGREWLACLETLGCIPVSGEAPHDVRLDLTDVLAGERERPVITLTDKLSLAGSPFEEEVLLGLHAALCASIRGDGTVKEGFR